MPYAVIYIWNLKPPTKRAETETNLWLPEVEGQGEGNEESGQRYKLAVRR